MARQIDMSAIISLERRKVPVSALAVSLKDEPIGVASITASELLAGYYRASAERQRQERLDFIEIILTAFPVFPFDHSAARTHARITHELTHVGQPIGTHDLLLVATALTLGYAVVTHNVRHFDRVEGLRVFTPTW